MDAIIAPNTVPLSEADGPPATGTPQFATNGEAGSTVPTQFPAYHYNGLVQEILALQEGAGLTNNRQVLTQVLQAVKRFAGGNVTTVTVSTTLTADNAGLVLVNAAGGNVVITLPPSASANGVPLPFKIIRTDTSTNTVTYAFSGEDIELPTASATGSVGIGGEIDLIGDGISNWWKPGNGRLLNVQYFLTSGVYTYTPTPGTKFIIVELMGGGGASGAIQETTSDETSAGGGGGTGAYARKRITSGFIGAPVVVGAAGAGIANAAGGNGGTSSVGSFVSANGGSGGGIAGPTGSSSTYFASQGLGGAEGISGDFSSAGIAGFPAQVIAGSGIPLSLTQSVLGGSFGFGGSPISAPPSTAGRPGNPGGGGAVIVHEYS
jgi:hypothetical protein